MVNRIGNNYTNPYVNTPTKTSSNGEKAPAFLLSFDEDGVIWDRESDGGKKDALQTKVGDNKGHDAKRDEKGVEYISTIQKSDVEELEAKEKAPSLFQIIGTLISSVRTAITKAFDYIWYGDDEKQSTVIGEAESENKEEIAGKDAEELGEGIAEDKARADSKISANVRRLRHRTEFEKKLADARNGVDGTPARNTDLLTTYDRRGNIRKISATDSSRILKGDKSIKL